MDITGAPIIMPTAKAVISVPALETLTSSAPEICGSRPEMTNSLVPMRKATAPSNHTTGGSLTFPAGTAVPPSAVSGAAAEGSGFVDEGELTDDPFKRAGAGPGHPRAFRQSGMRAEVVRGGRSTSGPPQSTKPAAEPGRQTRL